MKKLFYIPVFIIVILIAFSFSYKVMNSEKIGSIILLTKEKTFVAGNPISLTFKLIDDKSPLLYLHHSYGITLIEPINNGNNYTYEIPKAFSKKIGILDYTLILDGNIIFKNRIDIIPNETSSTQLESYFGPRSIHAGLYEYSMLVVVPTDNFDNPLPNNTIVNVHQQFLDNISSKDEKVENFFAWQNIYTRKKAGTILVSSTCKGTDSKELNTIIYPANATNFSINYTRNHNFADGNQLTSFTTSVIKDEYGNEISDGSYVEFLVTSLKNNAILKTNGTTRNGVATAKMLHPPYPDTWNVKAFVTGLAESNSIRVSYKPIINDYPIQFSKDNRRITVGPLKSFMNQLIPDGATVNLHIYNEKKFIETKTNTSKEGYTVFNLSNQYYTKTSYSLIIETLGVTKKFENLQYARIAQ
mgnify:FL=1|jgi:hypothetical protein